jgi:hypothetical protein
MNLIITLTLTSSLGETKVTPKAAANHELSMTQILLLTILKLVTHKAGTKHEFLFNEPASGSEAGLLNKRLC